MEKGTNLLQFKTPTSVSKRKGKKVLDEETYTEEIGKIVQRDFFPDLDKLKAQAAYLEAVETKNAKKLMEVFEKYNGRGKITGQGPIPITELLNPKEIEPDTEVPKKKRLSLDQYLNANTSQDNDSFKEIFKESVRKHTEKYSYLYHEKEAEKEHQKKKLGDQAWPVQTDFNVDTWGYKNRNYIMFGPEGVELTREEKIGMITKQREVVYHNTRLNANPFNEAKRNEAITEVAKVQAKDFNGKVGVDGKEILTPGTPTVRGFSFVQSPSATPGVLGTPLLTWGEIEGTPFRLDGSDTPLPKTPGPSFKISEPPRREQLALVLAEKAGEKNRDRKRRDIDAQKLQFSSPSPRPNSLSTIDRLAVMSPAAKRLANCGLKLGLGVNPNNPSAKSCVTEEAVTPLVKKKSHEICTDDLLRINLTRRHRAQDFF